MRTVNLQPSQGKWLLLIDGEPVATGSNKSQLLSYAYEYVKMLDQEDSDNAILAKLGLN